MRRASSRLDVHFLERYDVGIRGDESRYDSLKRRSALDVPR
jgi:hypothetical protein